MNLLAIDTAFETCSVALSLDGEVLEKFEHAPRGHAQLLLPWVEALLAETGTSLRALDGIGFSRGPGSFTSLRIGIGVVQGLAFGADLPVAPVSSLRVAAQVAQGEGVQDACVAMDARMDEVYTACFRARDGLMQAVTDERVCAAAEALPPNPADWTGVGNGFERFEVLANADFVECRTAIWPRAGVLASLAEAEFDGGRGVSADQAQPVYLRDKVAQTTAERA